jgi:predicted flap endonuclease-1-like 5' DNA nuclease
MIVDQTTLLVIIVGLVLVAVIAFALVRGGKRDTPDAITRDGHEKDVSPVITGPAAAPIDVPPAVDLAPEPEPEPRPEPETVQVAAPVVQAPLAATAESAGPPDELTRMKGVGPKVAALLASLGVTRFDQIAAWTDADVARIDAQLGAFKGRVTRDQWVEQARLLAAGDTAGYEAKFGKLG